MNRYIYYQDFHIKGINPNSRIDNYYESCLQKFKEILSIAIEKKVDAIIDGGDMWDIPIVSNKLIDDILDLIEETNIPFYIIYGNHCELSHHKQTSGNSSLTHMLRRSKILYNVDQIEDKTHIIKFIDYSHGIEQKIKDEGIIFKEEAKWKIVIIHGFVTPKPFLPTVLHVVADDIKTNVDLAIIAHYHSVWQKQVGKTKYIDIGCLGRCSITEANIHPSCLLLDFSKKIESITEAYEIIPLKSAKPGKEVFNLDAKELVESNEREMELFINSLRDFQIQDTDLRGNVEYIAKSQNIERPVIDRILEKLSEVEK